MKEDKLAQDNTENKDKSFGISSWSLTNRTTVMVLTAIIFLAGLMAYNGMPRENFPEVVTPEIYIGTPYPGNSPMDIEKLITRPIEKEVNTITGIDEINSTSVQGYSSIQVKFDFSVTPEEALRKVKDKVDIAMSDSDFPKDLPADPNVFEMNFSELVPIMNINLSGEFSLDQLKKYAEYLEDEIEDLSQISKVEIRGVMDKEVKVNVDVLKMEARQVSFGDIASAIRNENMTISGGDIKVGEYKRSVRVIGEFSNWRDMENIVIKSEKGNIIYLRDVATVGFGEEDKESFAREYRRPVVMLDVFKRAGENLIEASESINLLLEKAKTEEFPNNLSISLTSDQSDQTKTQVSELENSILFGMVLVIGVLMFFLGIRNALFVGIAIPLSMLLSFLILSSMGVTLNVMVLFSLVLALGMLVDNGIVVVENIYRLMDEGYPRLKAAKAGVGEVAWPIIASTATTLAAFVPLALWPGQMGEFMKFLPITLMIVLSSSLFVALIINPVLTSFFMKIQEQETNVRNKTLIFYFIFLVVGLIFNLIGSNIQENANSLITAFQQAPEGIIQFGGMVNFLGSLIISVVLFMMLGKYMFLAKDEKKSKVLLPGITLVVLSFVFFMAGQQVSGNFIGITGTFLILNAYILFPASNGFQAKLLPLLEKVYDRFIHFALRKRNPYKFLGGTLGLLVFSFWLVGKFAPKVEFFPINEPQYLNIFIEMPIGTDIYKTDEISNEIEGIVIAKLNEQAIVDNEPYTYDGNPVKYMDIVESVIGQVGKGTSDPAQGPSLSDTPHKARITVSFVKYQDRMGLNTSDIQSTVRKAIKTFPGVKITVSKNEAGPPQGAAINMELAGDDYLKLMDIAEDVKSFVNESGIAGIEELKLDVEQGKPELPVIVDRDKARRLGLSTAQVGDAIRTSLFGKEVSTYKEGEDDYPINIRFNEQTRDDLDAIMNQRITYKDMNTGKVIQVPISAVADYKKTSTFSAVKRTDLKRIITISSNTLEGYNANEVVANIKESLKSYQLPEDITLDFTGQQEEQAKEMSFLGSALGIAFALIIFIIVLQFNSTSTPFIIGISVFFSLIGVLIGLVAFQMDFIIIMTMIGIISLAGIVVNNAIVLIDYTNLIIDRRRDELGLAENEKLSSEELMRCVEEGGRTRLRPVLLTAITTVLGLLPLAVGLNIDFFGFFTELNPHIYMGGDNVIFWGPMSWTIIFGLTFATFLTLVIVPILYFLLKKLKYRVKKA